MPIDSETTTDVLHAPDWDHPAHALVGFTVEDVEEYTDDYGDEWTLIKLSRLVENPDEPGTYLTETLHVEPSRDEEGNGPGWLFVYSGDIDNG